DRTRRTVSTTPPRPLSPTSSGRAAAAAMAAARQALADGLAHNAAGRPVRASARFRAALRRLDAPGVDAQGQEVSWIRARAVLGLVMSDFELRADVGGSLALLDEAESAALRAGDAATRVAVLGQRGLLWHRAGSPVEALREHDKAVARISSAEPVDACCILLNRGSLHLELGHLAEARSDLLDCATRAAGIGDDQLAFKARHNLGYAEYLAGDLPGALSAMAEAADAVGGESPPVALLDRAQVLLEAGLVTEADEMLARAGAGFAAQRLTLDLAQVELARAECALLLGRPSAALEWASTARRRLTRRGHPRWLAVARLTELRSRLDSELARRGDPDAVALGRIAADAHALAHQPGPRGRCGRLRSRWLPGTTRRRWPCGERGG
ncbi:MAG TPA: hypothetical protein PKB06_08005, partial [Actinotalea sp.]|nr:hypothetical protein [Actinotalea sp.]